MAADKPVDIFTTQESFQYGFSIQDNCLYCGPRLMFTLLRTDINNMDYYISERRDKDERKALVGLVLAWFHRRVDESHFARSLKD